jgi:RNA polymerase sigma-70 factor (ECF subfamily)
VGCQSNSSPWIVSALQTVESALAAIEGLELESYPYLHATRADFLRRLGRRADARTAYGRALALVRTDPERRFLERRLAELGG